MSKDKIIQPTITDWDDAYANAAHIPDSAAYLRRWAEQSTALRHNQQAQGQAMVSLEYGPHKRECIDLFQTKDNAKGLAIFVHGGYWLRFAQRDWSHLAAGAVRNGYTTALIGYPLCPEYSIGQITQSVANAVELLSQRYPDLPVFLSGHSAGGHLVSYLIANPATLSNTTRERIKAVLSISGVHDLVPLTKTTMNEQFGMSLHQAITLSPARLRPQLPASIIAWVGADERPEFIRQNQLLESCWQPYGQACHTHIEPDRHHFDVINDLADAQSNMLKLWLGS